MGQCPQPGLVGRGPSAPPAISSAEVAATGSAVSRSWRRSRDEIAGQVRQPDDGIAAGQTNGANRPPGSPRAGRRRISLVVQHAGYSIIRKTRADVGDLALLPSGYHVM